jgi:hypothetical protein
MRNVSVRSTAIAKAITYDDSYFWEQGDKVLDSNLEAGRFLLKLLIAVSATGSIWALIFNHSF